jgi:threonine dehydratase
MQESYVERILKARVYDVAIESPLEAAPRLSRRLGNAVLFKREDLQPVFSFKLRGAYNRISHLAQSIAARGVICASAGNHAQGVALAAKRRSIPAVIVMPRTTPHIKVQAVLDLGAEVVMHGDDFDHAYEHAVGLARERGLTFIHPFDDPDVIAGQGTIGMESCASSPRRRTRSSCRSAAGPDRRHLELRKVAVSARGIIGVEPRTRRACTSRAGG